MNRALIPTLCAAAVLVLVLRHHGDPRQDDLAPYLAWVQAEERARPHAHVTLDRPPIPEAFDRFDVLYGRLIDQETDGRRPDFSRARYLLERAGRARGMYGLGDEVR